MISLLDIPQKYRNSIVALVGAKLEPSWWFSENRAFGFSTPIEQWEHDKLVVIRYIINQSDYIPQ